MNDSVFIHPTACVEENVQIGAGTRIWNYSHIRRGAVIGENCTIGAYVTIDENVRIGKGCKIQNYSVLYHGVTLADSVFIGPRVTTTNDLRPRANTKPGEWTITHTFFDEGASVGAGATIVCGVYLGKHCLVAAGSVVSRDVSPFSMVKGNPARACAIVCHCGRPCRTVAGRRFSYRCMACQKIITISEDVKVLNLHQQESA